MQHAYETGLCQKTKKQLELCRKLGKQRSKAVNQYDLEGNFIKEWSSQTEASRELNIDTTSISNCCMGKKNKTAGGYKWKFKDTQ